MKTTKTLFGILAITALLTPARAQVPFTNSLVGYYPFDGNANDASGNGNNGMLFGEATFGTDRFGNTNACLSLPGTEGFGSGMDIPSLLSMLYLPVTYSAWFWLSNYPPDPTGVSVMDLVGREQCGNTAGGAVSITGGGAAVVNNSIRYFGGGPDGALTQLVPPTNQWSQVVLTIDSSGNQNFYFNGTNLPSSGPFSAGEPLDFRIGCSGSGGCDNGTHYVWNGLIDDVRVYNRDLSSNEVQELYAYEGGPPPCTNYYPAAASPTVVDGFVVAATITDSGCGYSNAPLVLIQGGGGTGATATAVVSNGVVASITITDAGIDYTSLPTIYIYFLPAIAAQPQSVVTNANSTALFSVTATGTPPLSYQWSFNNTNIFWATNSTLTISNVVQTNLGNYAVSVTSPFGTTNSSNAVLSMYPYLVSPFDGLDTDWGYTNLLSAQAWGSGPLSFQWYQNGVALPGATNETLDFTGIQFTNAGLYSLVVSNPFGSVTNTPEQVVVNPAGISLGLFPGVIIQGVVGYNYIIQSTTNLSNTNAWVTLTNLTLTQPIQLWIDSNTDTALPGNPHRFYQVLPGQ